MTKALAQIQTCATETVALQENASIAYQGAYKDITEDLLISFVDYTDRKPTTVKGYLKSLKPFMEWLQACGIDHPTRDDIKAYRDFLATRNLAASTQSQYLRTVKHFFKWTASEGLYPNVADNIHGAKIRNDIHKRDAFTASDILAIEDTIERETLSGKRLYAMFLLAYVCGLRTIEISRSNIEDMKTIAGKPYLYIQGKGHDDKDMPKSLIPEVKAAIEAYLEVRTDAHKPNSPLFVSTSNRSKGKRIDPSTISKMLKGAAKAAGYDSNRLTAHSFRHTAATVAFGAGCSLYEVQKLQGHQNPATTEIYIHDTEATDIENKGRAAIYEYIHTGGEAIAKRNEIETLLQDITDLQTLSDIAEYVKVRSN